MEFDKSRVYTALNADELQIGSRCIFANTIAELRNSVQDEDAQYYMSELTQVFPDRVVERFEQDETEVYGLAYLIEPPAEPKYKPFSSIEKAFEAIKKHNGWVKKKANGDLHLVSNIGKITDGRLLISCWTSETFLKNFVFADDNSPCGELVEE